jgi:hypothetical protein
MRLRSRALTPGCDVPVPDVPSVSPAPPDPPGRPGPGPAPAGKQHRWDIDVARAASMGHRCCFNRARRAMRQPPCGTEVSVQAGCSALSSAMRERVPHRRSPGHALDVPKASRSWGTGLPVGAGRCSARMAVIVAVIVRMITGGGSALTGRVGRHSTAGLAVVAAASLAFAQLEERIGGGHPQLHRQRRVVGGPVGQQGPRVWPRPGFVTGLWHTANATTNAVPAPVASHPDS